jgi:putative NADH-flavin reductase
MQLTVFGASGKVGRQVVALALERGYSVRAFVHSHNPFEADERLEIVQSDVADPDAVKRAVQGSDAVISALGSWGTKQKNVVSSGMATIIPAMQAAGVKRLVTVTGSGAFWSGDKPSLIDKFNHFALGLGAAKILEDGEKHLELLEASDLDWTCVRSPVMTNRSQATYRLELRLPAVWATVPRAAVVRCLVDLATNQDFLRQAPVIYRDSQAPWHARG